MSDGDSRARGYGEEGRDVVSLAGREHVAAQGEEDREASADGDAGEGADGEELPVRLDPVRGEARALADDDGDDEEAEPGDPVRGPADDQAGGGAHDEEGELEPAAEHEVLLAVVETKLLSHRAEVGGEEVLVRVQEHGRQRQEAHGVVLASATHGAVPVVVRVRVGVRGGVRVGVARRPGAARASTTPRASTSLDRRRFAGDTSCASTSCSLASLDASPSPTASEDGPPHRAPLDAADDISTEPAVAGARLSGGALADAVVETRVRVARPRERS